MESQTDRMFPYGTGRTWSSSLSSKKNKYGGKNTKNAKGSKTNSSSSTADGDFEYHLPASALTISENLDIALMAFKKEYVYNPEKEPKLDLQKVRDEKKERSRELFLATAAETRRQINDDFFDKPRTPGLDTPLGHVPDYMQAEINALCLEVDAELGKIGMSQDAKVVSHSSSHLNSLAPNKDVDKLRDRVLEERGKHLASEVNSFLDGKQKESKVKGPTMGDTSKASPSNIAEALEHHEKEQRDAINAIARAKEQIEKIQANLMQKGAETVSAPAPPPSRTVTQQSSSLSTRTQQSQGHVPVNLPNVHPSHSPFLESYTMDPPPPIPPVATSLPYDYQYDRYLSLRENEQRFLDAVPYTPVPLNDEGREILRITSDEIAEQLDVTMLGLQRRLERPDDFVKLPSRSATEMKSKETTTTIPVEQEVIKGEEKEIEEKKSNSVSQEENVKRVPDTDIRSGLPKIALEAEEKAAVLEVTMEETRRKKEEARAASKRAAKSLRDAERLQMQADIQLERTLIRDELDLIDINEQKNNVEREIMKNRGEISHSFSPRRQLSPKRGVLVQRDPGTGLLVLSPTRRRRRPMPPSRRIPVADSLLDQAIAMEDSLNERRILDGLAKTFDNDCFTRSGSRVGISKDRAELLLKDVFGPRGTISLGSDENPETISRERFLKRATELLDDTLRDTLRDPKDSSKEKNDDKEKEVEKDTNDDTHKQRNTHPPSADLPPLSPHLGVRGPTDHRSGNNMNADNFGDDVLRDSLMMKKYRLRQLEQLQELNYNLAMRNFDQREAVERRRELETRLREEEKREMRQRNEQASINRQRKSMEEEEVQRRQERILENEMQYVQDEARRLQNAEMKLQEEQRRLQETELQRQRAKIVQQREFDQQILLAKRMESETFMDDETGGPEEKESENVVFDGAPVEQKKTIFSRTMALPLSAQSPPLAVRDNRSEVSRSMDDAFNELRRSLDNFKAKLKSKKY
eukprot:g88.t1